MVNQGGDYTTIGIVEVVAWLGWDLAWARSDKNVKITIVLVWSLLQTIDAAAELLISTNDFASVRTGQQNGTLHAKGYHMQSGLTTVPTAKSASEATAGTFPMTWA